MSVLRVGIDARELMGDATGVGRYLGELLRRWSTAPDATSRRFVLYAPGNIPLRFPAEAVETCILPGRRGTWWEQTTLRGAARRDSLDVFFAPAYTAPLGLGVPLVVTIHDVSFFAHPEWFRPREGLRRRFVTSRTARSASAVLTDSEFSRREIQAHLRVAGTRVHVIPPGVAPRHDGRPPARRRERLVLYAGSLFNRRRLPQLIEAFSLAAQDLPDARLVIVGDDRTWPRQDLDEVAARYGMSDQVRIARYLDDAELAALYARAAAFVFLSEYEGFGLTPLEALAAGVPIVVLDTPVAREVYGPAAVYVQDTAGAARAMREMLLAPGHAPPTLAAAAEVLARYSWDRAAGETLRVIEQAVRSR